MALVSLTLLLTMRLASGSRQSFVFVIGVQVPNLATQWHFLELQFFQ